jgi:hypothetical protein
MLVVVKSCDGSGQELRWYEFGEWGTDMLSREVPHRSIILAVAVAFAMLFACEHTRLIEHFFDVFELHIWLNESHENSKSSRKKVAVPML